MLEKDKEYKPAGYYAWFAARDASFRSAVNSSLFNDKQKTKAERVKLGLEMTYSCSQVSITYCKKWIRVKVHNGKVKDKHTLNYLEQQWDQEGVTKTHTPQGIIYHVI